MPEVLKLFARVRLPARLIVRAASFRVSVRVRPAVRFSEFARVRSNAPEPVERIPSDVNAV